MYSPAMSSSSSASSTRDHSPDTRATTPASSSSLDLGSKYSYLPKTYACVPKASLDAELLSAVFETHAASCGRLGLVVAEDTSAIAQGDVWTKEPSANYFVSSTYVYEPTHGYSPESLIPTSPAQARVQHILSECGLRSIIVLPLPAAQGTLYVLEKPLFAYKPVAYTNAHSLAPGSEMTGNIPTMEEWHTLWATWDTITLRMIPPEMLHQKPIDLRHKCLFYIGHIPTFVDMLLVKAIGGKPTEPAFFWNIFERGIDPHVDDPDHCHNHSEVPTNDADWPTLASILAFRDGVRARLAAVYAALASGARPLTRNLARTLVMTYEHEGFHAETLLYMLIQKAGDGATVPPPAPAPDSEPESSEHNRDSGVEAGFTPPPWDALAAQWAQYPAPNTPSVVLGPAEVIMGHDDSEADDFVPWPSSSSSTSTSSSSSSSSPSSSPSSSSSSSSSNNNNDQSRDPRGAPVLSVAGRTFGWDNESPPRAVHVPAFRASWRPVTNAEFAAFWRAGDGAVPMPKSWVLHKGEGEGEGSDTNSALDNSAIMVRTLYGFVPLDGVAASWPVLTSHDDLAAYARSKGGRLPSEPELRLFLDTYDVGHEGGANVGFRNWHPVPATTGLDAYGGKGSNGGVWEWTSTVFDTHEGLVPTQLFTGYSEDFFDTKHQVALGASYATIPRLGRRTVRNFYQHNYPYPWIGARVVYDI